MQNKYAVKSSCPMEEAEDQTIAMSAFIHNELIGFKNRKFFDGKIKMAVPNHFIDMPIEMINLKYPNEQHPQVILTNPKGDTNLTISLFEQSISNDEIHQAVAGYQVLLHKNNPSFEFYEEKIEPLGETFLGWFDFKSNAIDTDLYNLMYVTSISGKCLLGSLNCRFCDYAEWKLLFLEMIRSICNLTKNNSKTRGQFSSKIR